MRRLEAGIRLKLPGPGIHLKVELTESLLSARHSLLVAKETFGSGGDTVVGVPFYGDDLNSNPAEAFTFSVKCCLKRTKINHKEAGDERFF